MHPSNHTTKHTAQLKQKIALHLVLGRKRISNCSGDVSYKDLHFGQQNNPIDILPITPQHQGGGTLS